MRLRRAVTKITILILPSQHNFKYRRHFYVPLRVNKYGPFMICASKNQGELLHHPHIHEITRVKIRYGNPRVFVIAPDQSYLIYVIYIYNTFLL